MYVQISSDIVRLPISTKTGAGVYGIKQVH